MIILASKTCMMVQESIPTLIGIFPVVTLHVVTRLVITANLKYFIK